MEMSANSAEEDYTDSVYIMTPKPSTSSSNSNNFENNSCKHKNYSIGVLEPSTELADEERFLGLENSQTNASIRKPLSSVKRNPSMSAHFLKEKGI